MSIKAKGIKDSSKKQAKLEEMSSETTLSGRDLDGSAWLCVAGGGGLQRTNDLQPGQVHLI